MIDLDDDDDDNNNNDDDDYKFVWMMMLALYIQISQSTWGEQLRVSRGDPQEVTTLYRRACAATYCRRRLYHRYNRFEHSLGVAHCAEKVT